MGGDASVVGDVDVTGATLVRDTTDAVGASSPSSLRTMGGLAVAKSVVVGSRLTVDGSSQLQAITAAGRVHIANDADAEGANHTASLYTDGGVAVARHLSVGEGADVVGTLTVSEHALVEAGVDVGGSLNVAADATVTGTVSAATLVSGHVSTGSLSVSGSTVLDGSISLTSHDGDIVTTGDGDIGTTGSGDIVTTGTGDIRTVAGDILAGGNL